MRRTLCFVLMILALLLCGCGKTAPAPEVVPEPTPEPTPVPTPPPTEWVISGESAEEILALGEIKTLKHIDAAASREYEALLQLREKLPECEIEWVYELNGVMYPNDTEELTAETLDGLEDALRYLPELRSVDLLACDVTTDDIDRFTEINPDADYLWWVKFGRWVVRSDIQIFSTMRTTENHRYTNEELYPLLHYCTKLRALDLGHNALTDVTDIGRMTDLQVLIIADNKTLTDISPLKSLDKLYYLEMFLCVDVEDFGGLEGMTAMEDLNVCYCRYLNDPGFLEQMPKLRMFWCHHTGIGLAEIEPHKLDDCLYITASEEFSSVGYGWRATDRNIAIRHLFHHFEDVKEFVNWDEIVYKDEAAMEGRDGTVKFSY